VKQLTNMLFYSLVIVGTIVILFLEWQDKPVIASHSSPKDNYYSIVLDQQPKEPNEPGLIDAPVIKQLPELPRGCEVTSLAMLLNQAGLKVDKMTLAKEIKKDPTPYKIINGQVHFGNPSLGFVGSIYSYDEPGLGVYHGPIADLASRYLPQRIVDISGKNFNEVEAYLDKGQPVWVIVSSTYTKVPNSDWMTWMTEKGPIHVTKKEHSVLLTGYDDSYVYFNDPLTGVKNMKAKKMDFIQAWQQFGSQSITYE
jgi:uncharacterized protein YvpB